MAEETIFNLLDKALLATSLVAYLLAYLGGLLASFTACSYSLLPITLAIIGANSAQTNQNGFLLSIFYVFGLALVYTLLGALAALAGVFFGSLQANPLTNLFVAVVFIMMGLSLLGLFAIPFFTPRFVGKARSRYDRASGYLRVFLLGALSALITSPCASPIIIALLGYTATTGNVFYGMSLFFFFALGMGALLVLAGTSAGLLANLPKAGRWMEMITKICGGILVLAGVYFLAQALIAWWG